MGKNRGPLLGPRVQVGFETGRGGRGCYFFEIVNLKSWVASTPFDG